MLQVPWYLWSIAFGNRFFFRYLEEAGISEASEIKDPSLLSRTLDGRLQLLGSSLGMWFIPATWTHDQSSVWLES